MDTELAPFTKELFQLLGIIEPAGVEHACLISPLDRKPARAKQKPRNPQQPGCVSFWGSTWGYRIAYSGVRVSKGGFPTEEAARKAVLERFHKMVEEFGEFGKD